MSTNHHTPIDAGAAVNVLGVNTPMGQLDSAVSGLQSGAVEHTGMRFTATFTDAALSVADSITLTSITHNVKARTGTQDFLADILGGVDGQIVILKAYTGHTITVRTTGNIGVPTQFRLSGNQVLILHLQGSTWREYGYNNRVKFFNEDTSLADGADEIAAPYTSYYSYTSGNARRIRLDVTPALSARAHFGIRCASGATYPSLIAAPTSTGTVAASNENDTFNSHTSGAVAGNTAGLVSSTFNVWRINYRPIFACRFMTGSNISGQRIYIGIAGATPANSDTLTTSFIGIRYSTVAGDTGFMAVTCDGTTQTLGTSLATVFADTTYDLRVYYTSTSAIVALRLGGAGSGVWVEQTVTGGPFSGIDVGWAALLITTGAAARVIKLSRVYGEYGGY